jgi:hypothetical protein
LSVYALKWDAYLVWRALQLLLVQDAKRRFESGIAREAAMPYKRLEKRRTTGNRRNGGAAQDDLSRRAAASTAATNTPGALTRSQRWNRRGAMDEVDVWPQAEPAVPKWSTTPPASRGWLAARARWPGRREVCFRGKRGHDLRPAYAPCRDGDSAFPRAAGLSTFASRTRAGDNPRMIQRIREMRGPRRPRSHPRCLMHLG